MCIINSSGVYFSDFNYFRLNCCASTDVSQRCDFSQYTLIDQYGTITPNYTGDTAWDACADKISSLVAVKYTATYTRARPGILSTNVDCYSRSNASLEELVRVQRTREALEEKRSQPDIDFITDGRSRFADQGVLFNARSSDPFGGFSCYAFSAAQSYLNCTAVRNAIHIPQALDGRNFSLCE